MSFKIRPTADLPQIAGSGGGFRLDATIRPTADLIQIAADAHAGNARIFMDELQIRFTAYFADCCRWTWCGRLRGLNP